MVQFLRYDIALLRLSSDATLNNYVQLGVLPPANQVLPHNNPCYISGWGRTQSEFHVLPRLSKNQGGMFQVFLKAPAGFIVSPGVCSWRTAVRPAEAGLPARR